MKKRGFSRGQGVFPVMHYAGNVCQCNGSKSVMSVGLTRKDNQMSTDKGNGNGGGWGAAIFWLLFIVFVVPIIFYSCDFTGERRRELDRQEQQIRQHERNRQLMEDMRQRGVGR